MKEDSNIDDLFRSSFEGFEVAPPAAVKTAIDHAIGGNTSRRFLWFILFALLLGTGLAFGIYTFSGNAGNAKPATAGPGTSSASASRNGENAPKDPSGNASGKTAANTHTAQHSGTVHGASLPSAGTSVKKADRNASSGKTAASGKNGASAGSKKSASAAAQKTPAKKRRGKKRPSGSGNSGLGSLAALAQNNGPGVQSPGSNQPSGNANPPAGNTGTPPASGTNPPETPPVTPVNPTQPAVDHSDDSSFDESPAKPTPKPDEDPKLWRASIYAGPQFGINGSTGTDTRKLSETSAFAFSGEINRSLFAGYGLTTGFGYTAPHDETFAIDEKNFDSTVVIESIPIFDPNFPDSIIGYDTILIVSYDTTGFNSSVTSSISTLSIPLYFSKSFEFGDKWGMLVNAGATFNFYKVTLGTVDSQMPPPQLNDFSVNLLARVHLTYAWNRFLFSAGVNTGFDMKPAIRYDAIDRKRYYITPQVGVHFSF